MKRALVVLAVLVAAAFAVNAAAAPTKTIRKCIPNKQAGIDRIGKTTLIVYCGSAKATMKSGTKTTKYVGGACLKIVGDLVVGFGKFTSLVSPVALSNSFYLVIPASGDGTFNQAVLTLQTKGKTAKAANRVKVVVSGNRSRGTFKGKILNGPKFTGSFTCK
jgi:hypothetical protein